MRLKRLASITLLASVFATGLPAADMDKARQLAQDAIIVDTHVDAPYQLENDWNDVTGPVPERDFDFPRAREGGLDAPFMSIYVPAETQVDGNPTVVANRLIDHVEAMVYRAPDKAVIAHSVADVRAAAEAGKIALPLGIENGAPIQGNLDNLQHFYDRGVRYITLAHSRANHISDSSYDENRHWYGLSPFGRELVKAMNRIGVMIDVSHITDAAFEEVIEISAVPVVATHSSARHFTPGWERNMSDELIKTLAENGGVININFGSSFISQASFENQQRFSEARAGFMEQHGIEDRDHPKVQAFTERYREKYPYRYATLDEVLDQYDHVIEIAGIDHVGIGSDYDGVGDSLPEGLKDVSTYPNLIAGLMDRGYSEAEIRKILGENMLRVWRQVEEYAASHGDS